MEFKQTTDLTKLPPIEFNFDELKKELSEGLQKYKGMVVTADGIKDAKLDRTDLNSLFKKIDDRRKEIKKECMKPYDAFEQKAKILLEMISSTSGEIDKQIKAFEELEKENKRKEIERFYCDNIGDLRDLISFNRIFDATWLNKGSKMSAIETEIIKTIAKVTADLAVINDPNDEFALQCKDKYLQTLDLSATLAEKRRLEENKKRLEEYEAKQGDFERIKNVKLAGFIMPITEMPEGSVQAEIPVQDQTEIILKYDFTIWATDEQRKELMSFLFISGIKFEKK